MTFFVAKWHTSLTEISENDWNALLINNNMPFYKWNWLNQLEQSGSVSIKSGWQPLHLSIWRNKKLIAIAPLYLKNHSYGEFVFDQIFVNLSIDLGLNYYPKLIGMSPFSPVEGYKFFVSKEENEEYVTKFICDSIDKFATKNGILSCSFLYVDKEWMQFPQRVNFKPWINQQPLWKSSGEKDFTDYLSNFNSNQRRNIKRERTSIRKSGLIISSITGNNIKQDLIELMYDFYNSHCEKWGAWGSKYLSRQFFQKLISSNQKEEIVLFSAHKGNHQEPIAMSFCITNMEKLWGRYWGTKEDINSLHFEVCYYSPIEWCIRKGIKEFDPGAGGTHKKRRGFLASPRISLHKWYDNRMDSLLEKWLPKVNALMIEEINTSNNEAPLKS